jgi:3-hydroxyanthranilate 3,4-dioxygenase
VAEEERYPIPGSARSPPKKLTPPLDFTRWIDENLHNLKPPVGAFLVYDTSEDYIVMVVGGPNRRRDYHVNMSEEFFYQIRGDMVLKVA